ncbi:MAG: hypothetical protein IKJ62_03515 [Alphaproteobacteria bacterium]|nr:hypothetical protein [Alphaproteobacteria bacterium]
MILFFNKQFRAENGLINDLAKKIRKSELMGLERSIHGNTEIYTLGDNISISFDILGNKLTVAAQKTGEHILDMNCEYVGGRSDAAELQNARFHMFSRLLSVARETYEAHLEKTKRLSKAIMKKQAEEARLDKAKAEKKAAEVAITTARQRLKSL